MEVEVSICWVRVNAVSGMVGLERREEWLIGLLLRTFVRFRYCRDGRHELGALAVLGGAGMNAPWFGGRQAGCRVGVGVRDERLVA